ncbi:helicase-associated domain-containing protein [Rugosimonospora acidiphila]|uniref:Helicase-associated domain-containing protein n=1 Tax=Rugosimonospora acidiphila TaxID=556531 RepID=A0ABP9RPF3_9ACTN
MASSLSRWLGALEPDRLSALLTRRPEALTEPVPRTLGELAGRLQGRFGVAGAVQSVPLPAVQVLETVYAYDCQTRADLADLLDGDGLDGDGLDEALTALADRALLWEYEGRLGVAGEAISVLGYPLRLGPNAADLLAVRPVTELRGIAGELGLAAAGPVKRNLLRELAGFYGNPERIRGLAASAPAETRAVLDGLTWHGPLATSPTTGFGGPAGPRYLGPEDWAVRRGLLLPDGWQQLAMPREVALALRGPGWRPPFDPRPPSPAPAEVDESAVAREATAAAGTLVDQVNALLAAGPIARLKSGGVGAREQRRLAKLIGADEPGVRLAVELAHGAGLLAATPEAVLPTEAYDQWAAAEPPERLPPLLVAWLRLPVVGWRDGAALIRDPVGRLMPDLRMELLAVAAALPEGRGLAEEGYLSAAVRWHAPVLAGAFEDPAEFIGPLWAEAARLGLVAHGTLSPLGRALIALDAERLGRAASDLLDTATGTAIFQADLTAVVPGAPSAALASLLDGSADRESRGTASTWRFTAASVRRALDTGATAPELLARLRAVATGGTLPQPLEYLLGDVARRHGALRVRAVGCVLHAGDPAMLAELLASRALAALHLRELAPTVLASAASPADTLAALRSAGYAPVREDASGEPLVERVDRRRAAAPARHRTVRRPQAGELADPAVLAKSLLSAQDAEPATLTEPPTLAEPPTLTGPPRLTGPAGFAGPLEAGPAARRHRAGGREERPDTLETIGAHAPGLDEDELRLLAHAIDSGGAVRIAYRDADGRSTVRVIEEIELSGAVMEAWCRLREDERMFMLARVEAVAPV